MNQAQRNLLATAIMGFGIGVAVVRIAELSGISGEALSWLVPASTVIGLLIGWGRRSG